MKKIISLLVAAMLVVSMATVAGAATYYGSFTAPNLTTADLIPADDNNPNGYYAIDVKIDDLLSYEDQIVAQSNSGKLNGYATAGIEISFDSSKFTPGYVSEVGRGGSKIYTYVKENPLPDKFLNPATGNLNVANTKVTVSANNTGSTIKAAVYAAGADAEFDSSHNGADFVRFYLTPVEGATGVSDIVLSYADLGVTYTAGGTGVIPQSSIKLVNGSIDLGGEVGPAEKPETTVVKTFPKRFYAEKAITTVGVILEGKDYDNATSVKAGIKTQRDEENVNTYAPGAIASATDEDKSYVMVTIGEITDTTVFQPTTPTWAFVEIDGNLIEGEKVTENVTDATDVVTDADFED